MNREQEFFDRVIFDRKVMAGILLAASVLTIIFG